MSGEPSVDVLAAQVREAVEDATFRGVIGRVQVLANVDALVARVKELLADYDTERERAFRAEDQRDALVARVTEAEEVRDQLWEAVAVKNRDIDAQMAETTEVRAALADARNALERIAAKWDTEGQRLTDLAVETPPGATSSHTLGRGNALRDAARELRAEVLARLDGSSE